jgi:hypothetical protein
MFMARSFAGRCDALSAAGAAAQTIVSNAPHARPECNGVDRSQGPARAPAHDGAIMAPAWNIALVAAGALAAGALALVFGAWRWQRATAAEVDALLHAAARPQRRVDFRQLAGLPPPVARYLRRVLTDGAPIPHSARIAQQGAFRIDLGSERWFRFTATQTVTIAPPGFVWDARLRLAPGIDIRVRDGYRAGTDSIRAAVAGLFTVAALRGGAELAAGALQRYLAEAPWFPYALLPEAGVTWRAIDERRALATLRDGAVAVALEFTFNEAGDIERSYTPARPYEDRGAFRPLPWGGTNSRWEERGGVRIPVQSEVAWYFPAGAAPYWRGRIAAVDYR